MPPGPLAKCQRVSLPQPDLPAVMTDVDIILALIEARADHYAACADTMFDVDEDVTEIQARFKAQARALVELAAEIKASLEPRSFTISAAPEADATTGYAFITEMGGQMTATIYRTVEGALGARNEFCAEAFVEGDLASHASCEIHEINIPPRRPNDFNEVDGRWALITEVQKSLQVTLCQDVAELRRLEKQMEKQYRFELKANEAAIYSHILVVPRMKQHRASSDTVH